MTTLRTTVRRYSFALPEEKHQLDELRKQLTDANHPPLFSALSLSREKFRAEDGAEIELETRHVFSNQWNSADGFRVFDWYEPLHLGGNGRSYFPGRGYYLEQTPEMREVRRNTLTCGWCGHHHQAATGLAFCPDCLHSQYLKRTDLHLTRLLPAERHLPTREPLTPSELARLLPAYDQAQGIGEIHRHGQLRDSIAKRYAQALASCDKARAAAHSEFEARNWLLDRGFGHAIIENLIHYTHTGRFCFGWRTPLTRSQWDSLVDHLSEFPFDYDLKPATRPGA